MPLVTDTAQLQTLCQSQTECNLCDAPSDDDSIKNKYIIVCDICHRWSCLECAEVSAEMYNLAIRKKPSKFNYVCPHCEEALPKVREMIQIQEKQQKILHDITNMKTDIQENKQAVAQQNQEQEGIKNRLNVIEMVIKKNKLADEEYPPLPTINATTQQLKQEITTQKQSTIKLNAAIQKHEDEKLEEKRKAAKLNNLIVYGLQENETTEIEQMRADFNTLKDLYADKASLAARDISQITRLGEKSRDKIRPIKITFTNLEKRKEILINNKNLRIEGFQFDMCNCTTNPGKHIHINVTTDKTKKERETEKDLRQRLKDRRLAGEDVIIKYGKIVQRRQQNQTQTQTRWADLTDDD